MKKLSTFISICTTHLVHLVAFLIPKKKNLWVTIGWHTGKDRELFADNSKYFFLHVSDMHKDIEIVWLSRDPHLARILTEQGYRAYSINSLKGIYYAIRAKYTFIDAYLDNRFFRYTGGSRIIQLWHGKGMKKTGYDSPYGTNSRSRFLQPGFFARLDRLIATSPYTANLMRSTFAVSPEKIIETGLPRNDVLFKTITGTEIDAHTKLKEITEKLRGENIKKILLYAPTFRPDGSNPLSSLDIPKLEKVLREAGYHLILSLHPKFARKDYSTSGDSDTVSYIESSLDIYPYLKHIDVLITDYSSLYVDFLLLDRPIIFYTYDFDNYNTQMGLHEDYLSLTPGPHPGSFTELLAEIKEEDKYAKERARVRQILFTHQDGFSSQRIVSEAIKL